MWPYPKILAHRGGGKLAPENTLAAMRCGLAHGYRAVEFDVMLARDGVAVLMHDPMLGRTIAGSGHVFDYDARELCAMDAGTWFSDQFRGETVPLFAEVIDFCRANEIWMNVEIKPAPGFEAVTGRKVAELAHAMFADQIKRGDVQRLPLLSSFSQAALAAARDATSDLPRACLFDTLPTDWEQQARALGAVAIHTNQKYLTLSMARAVKDAGFGLFCYTVNDPQRARVLFDWGVDGFCTDRIDVIGPDFR